MSPLKTPLVNLVHLGVDQHVISITLHQFIFHIYGYVHLLPLVQLIVSSLSLLQCPLPCPLGPHSMLFMSSRITSSSICTGPLGPINCEFTWSINLVPLFHWGVAQHVFSSRITSSSMYLVHWSTGPFGPATIPATGLPVNYPSDFIRGWLLNNYKWEKKKKIKERENERQSDVSLIWSHTR